MQKLAFLILLCFTVTSFVGCAGSSKKDDQQVTENGDSAEKVVNLFAQDFSPKTITLKVGEALTFVNADKDVRNISIPALNIDQTLQSNATWSYTFNVAGEYSGYDRLTSGKPTISIIVK